jgi:FkbH-like protein
VAYVVLRELEKEVSVSEWRQQLEERLPQYMVPSVFMVIDKMPLTASGKVYRRGLPEVEASRAELGKEYERPRTETEETLVSIWREVLNVEQVGIHDNFFELGGHSLLAARMVSLVRESFSVELPLRSLFESPTVAGLAACVETMLAGEQGLVLPPIERVERVGHLPLSFAQQRLWFLNKLDQRSSFFNMHQAVRLKGVLNTAALEQSLNEVLRRHEALRTKFVTVDGLAVQVIEPPQPFSLALEDLSALTRAEQETKVLALSKEESHHSFDLTQATLLRIRLLRLDSEEHVVLLTMHHIISDGWSIAVFFREMSTLYAAFSEGMKPTLTELPIQYADYAVWQRNRLHGEALASELSYWKKQLAGAPPALDLPADHPTASQLSQGARYSVTIPDSLVKQLKRFSLSQAATPFIILLAALKILLFRWTMQRDIVVGTVVANRDRVETENLIGCFMNFLPIRTETSEEETGLQLLRRIKNTVLGMYAHHDCPFEKIVEAANPERRPDQNPLYNVAFLLQNFSRTYDFSPTLEASMIPSARDSSLLDLRFIAEEYQEAIRLWCEYRADLFEAETIKQLVEGYRATLEKLLSEPQLTLSSFTLPEELEARAKQARFRKQEQTIAIAATFTAEPVEDSLDFWMRELEIPTHCAFAPFNQVFQQLLQPSSLMATNRNGVNVILIRLQDWGRRSHDDITETHSLVISPEEIERSVLEFIHALNSAAESSTTPYLLCLCPNAPNILSEPQTAEFFQRMEELLAANFKKSDGVYCVTITELAATYPVLDYYDAERDQLGQVPYTPAFFTALGMMLARKVSALKRPPYKVIVLDCDETLWKGVCGEDGPLGVEINAPRRALQEFMLAQYEQGMLLCLCSQNNEEDVLEVFKQHSEMALRPEHLAAWRINWRPKTENIKALAEELQLGLDSFIFVDNDPVICMQMQAECPEVLTLQLPVEAERIPKFLRHVWAFDHLKVTDADRQRTALYQQNQNRERLRSDSLSLEDFLAAIELEIRISEMSPQQLARVAQLTQRTNQFNFTNIERSESELKNLSQTGQLETLVLEVSDRFGDYGLVGVMIFESVADAINVDTFLLSCRALGRKLEHRMLARLGMIAYERRKQFVNVRLLRTSKNQPAQNFLSQVGMRFGELSDGAWNFKFLTEHLLTLDETTAHSQAKAHASD